MGRLRSHPLVERILESDTFQRIKYHLPPLNFITIHYAYFIVTCMITSLIFWGTSEPGKSISYTDSLFLVVSAMTEAGLNTVNLSQMTTFQQVILFLLIVIGSAIFVSIGTVLTRKRAFESRFKHVVKRQKESRRARRSRSLSVNPEYRGTQDVRGVERKEQREQKELEKGRPAGVQSRVQTPQNEPRDPLTINTTDGVEKSPEATLGDDPADKRERSPESTPNGKAGTQSPDEYFQPRGRVRTGSADHISFSGMHYAPSPSSDRPPRSRVLSFVGVGAHPNSTSFKPPYTSGLTNRVPGVRTTAHSQAGEKEPLELLHYPTYLTNHTTGRNGQFFGLSRVEREHLGGVEYRAITLLAYVVPLYFVLWQLLGCLGLAAYMAYHKADVARGNGINPWWLGLFNGVSAFNNSGMSLLDANMIPFQQSSYTLITMGLMILAGNTAYPLFLRFILWSLLKLLTLLFPRPASHAPLKATLRFILTYPRRVYTNLFTAAPTWWLFFTVVALNGIDWFFFEMLNLSNSTITLIPAQYRVLDGLFQALAVRSGGFYVVAISNLRISLQFLYVIMMYISAYPVVITMRHSNVYEERSLGIYTDDPDPDFSPSATHTSNPDDLPKLGHLFGKFKRTLTNNLSISNVQPGKRRALTSTGTHFARQQIRSQLAHDLWWLALAIFIIACVEVSNFDRDPVTYSVFNIAFEVVSAYGCVGISTGLPNEAYSFSGGWKVVSKLVLCAVMLRGRHRGLPVALDRAVRLPGSDMGRGRGGKGGGGEDGGAGEGLGLGEMEEEDAALRRSFSVRRGSVGAVERG